MYVAKMHTRYPDFHGKGYYNFIMDEDRGSLDAMIEENGHDFSHQKTVFIRMDKHKILEKYPTKQSINDKYFKGE